MRRHATSVGEVMVRCSSPKVATAALALGATLGATLGGGLFVSSPAGAGTTTVGAGDTLWGLAAEYGTTASVLSALNGITDPNRILAGQTLELPSGPDSVTVTVSPGETLTALAAEYGTTVSALSAANAITDPNLIVIGAHLLIPAGGAPTPPPSPPASTPSPPAPTAPSSVTSPTPTAVTAAASGSGPIVPSPTSTLAALFQEWSSAYAVPGNLLEALTWWESGWNNGEVSPTGAIGLGQLEPFTVDFIRTYLVGDQGLNPSDPSDNLQMTAAYLHDLLQATGGNEGEALAIYYQGLQSVMANGQFPDTQNYVVGILAYAQLFASQ